MTVMAAQREQRGTADPQQRGGKRWHVVSADGVTPACGAPMLLQNDMTIPAAEVMQSSRCQRPGCKHLWPRPSPTTNRKAAQASGPRPGFSAMR